MFRREEKSWQRTLRDLLVHLNVEYYSRQLNPNDCPESDSATYYKQRIKAIPQAVCFDGVTVYNVNHGALHHLRSISYVRPVLAYLSRFARPGLIESIRLLQVNKQDINKLQLCMAFSSIARTSEIDFSQQPETHRYYRRNAGDIFQKYYHRYKEQRDAGKSIAKELEPFSCFESDEAFDCYQSALVAMGDPSNDTPIHVVLNICHKLDLYRCRDMQFAEMSVDDYIRDKSDPDQHHLPFLDRLRGYAQSVMKALGGGVVALHIPMNETLFVNNSHNFESALSIISTQRCPRFDDHVDRSTEQPFFFRSIYTNDDDFWYEYLLSVTRLGPAGEMSVNNDKHIATRAGERGRYVLKTRKKTGSGQLELRYVDRYRLGTASFTPSEKNGFSKPDAMTYCDPRNDFTPPEYWQNFVGDGNFGGKQRTASVGVKIDPSDVLTARIYVAGAGTRGRLLESNDLQQLKKIPRLILPEREFQYAEVDALARSGFRCVSNEVLGRVKAISGILIFVDDLESRIIAQCRLYSYKQRMLDLQLELGVEFPEHRIHIPIEFYRPGCGDANVLESYPPSQQVLDWQQAQETGLLQRVRMRYPEYQQSFCARYAIRAIHRRAAIGDASYFDNDVGDINFQDARGKTPLHYAMQNGHIDLVLKLLDMGAQVLDDCFEYNVAQTYKEQSYQENSVEIYHDTFFTAALRCGRHDYALEFLHRCSADSVNDYGVVATIDQLIRILKPKNNRVIHRLVDIGYFDIKLDDASLQESNACLLDYAIRCDDNRLYQKIIKRIDNIDTFVSMLPIAVEMDRDQYFEDLIAKIASGDLTDLACFQRTLNACLSNKKFDFLVTLIQSYPQLLCCYDQSKNTIITYLLNRGYYNVVIDLIKGAPEHLSLHDQLYLLRNRQQFSDQKKMILMQLIAQHLAPPKGDLDHGELQRYWHDFALEQKILMAPRLSKKIKSIVAQRELFDVVQSAVTKYQIYHTTKRSHLSWTQKLCHSATGIARVNALLNQCRDKTIVQQMALLHGFFKGQGLFNRSPAGNTALSFVEFFREALLLKRQLFKLIGAQVTYLLEPMASQQDEAVAIDAAQMRLRLFNQLKYHHPTEHAAISTRKIQAGV